MWPRRQRRPRTQERTRDRKPPPPSCCAADGWGRAHTSAAPISTSLGCSAISSRKIKGHANGSLRVTRLTPFLEPRSDRRVSLGRGARLALVTRLLPLCPRQPCAPPDDTARTRRNR